MTPDNIVEIAINLKKKYKTNNPFKLLQLLGIEHTYGCYKKEAITGYIIRPYEDVPPLIVLNSNFDKKSQRIFCAHELGHAILHKAACNHFGDDNLKNKNEYEANLFAVSLLFNHHSFNQDIKTMDNFILKFILDSNVNY